MRRLINLVITAGLLLAFNAFDWLDLLHDGNPVVLDKLSGPVIGSVMIVALILWIAGIIARLAYVVLATVTLGLGLIAFPLITWFALVITAHFMPANLVLHGFWITVACGVIIGFARIPAQSRQDEIA